MPWRHQRCLGGGGEEGGSCISSEVWTDLNTELVGINLGEGGQGECPSVESGTEADGPLLGVHLGVSQGIVGVGGHYDVGRLHNAPGKWNGSKKMNREWVSE
jgi:hypothetical protein